MIKDYQYYPLTLKVVTNKATSVGLQSGNWVIDPTFDLNTNKTATIFDVIAEVKQVLANSVRCFQPRYNSGGYEPALPSLKTSLDKLDEIYKCALYTFVHGYVPDEPQSLIGTEYEDWKGATPEQMLEIEGLERWKIIGHLNSGVKIDIVRGSDSDESTEFSYNDYVRSGDFASLTIEFPGVKYIITRHYKNERSVTPVYLNLVLTREDGTKLYWSVSDQDWSNKFDHTDGFTAYIPSKSRHSGLEDITVRNLISLITSYVVDYNYLPGTLPVKENIDIIAGNKKAFVTFSGLHSELLELKTNTTSMFTLGVIADWNDFEHSGCAISWVLSPASPHPKVQPTYPSDKRIVIW